MRATSAIEPLEHRDKVTAAAFSPDGARVATASIDHSARIWDGAASRGAHPRRAPVSLGTQPRHAAIPSPRSVAGPGPQIALTCGPALGYQLASVASSSAASSSAIVGAGDPVPPHHGREILAPRRAASM